VDKSELPILELENFQNVPLAENYFVNIQKIGDSIVYTRNRGDMRQFDSDKFFLLLNRFIEEAKVEKPIVQIRNYENLTGITSEKQIEKQRNYMLEHQDDYIALLLCNTPFWLRIASTATYKKGIASTMFEVLNTFESALQRAEELIRTSPAVLESNVLLEKTEFQGRKRRITVKADHIYELSDYCEKLLLSDQHIPDQIPELSVKNPLKSLEKILSVVGNDFRELKQIESDRSKNLLDLLMSVQAGVIIIDIETHTIAFANKMAAAITETTRQSMIGKSCHQFICHESDKNCPVTDLHQVMENNECILIKSNGTECTVLKSIKIINFFGKKALLETFIDVSDQKQRGRRLEILTSLQIKLLEPIPLKEKFREITEKTVEAIEADFVRIWMLRPKDLCRKGCIHYNSDLYKKNCEHNKQCLHLISSSGRYTHINGDHRRVPVGAFNIGKILSGESNHFLTNSAETDKRIHNLQWVKKLGLKSFAGFKLTDSTDQSIGVFALFSMGEINNETELYLESIANQTSQVIRNEQTIIELKDALNFAERANNLMEGREVRIRQIKGEINELTEKLGWGDVYKETDSDSEKINDSSISLEDSRKNALSLAEDAEISRRETVALNEQLSLIQYAVNNSSDAVAISTLTGDFYYINHTFSSLFGYALDRLALLSNELLFADEAIIEDLMKRAASGNDWQGRTEIFTEEDRIVPVFMRIAPFKDNAGNMLGLIWNFTNITAQIQSEKKIQADLLEKKEMLYKATLLQKSFIQETVPLLNHFNIHALYMPCENLGGDFFRIIKGIYDNKLIVIMGDCTDHGVKASMDSSLLSSMTDKYLTQLYKDDRTDLFLNKVSREYLKVSDEDQFPTMFVMIIDADTGDFFYSNANSELPYIISGGETRKLDKAAGMHIGYFDDPVYERKQSRFRLGEQLLIYSDAVIEIEKKDKSQLGYEAFENILEHSEGRLEQKFNSLIETLEKENGSLPLNDDTTLIIIEFKHKIEELFVFHTLDEWQICKKQLKTILSDMDFSHGEIEKTGIALDELCINAFNHGNKKDTRKAVTVKASIDCCDIKFTITDEGKGFSPNSVIDPVSNIGEIMNRSVEEEYTHGRGIRISMNFFDFLEYNETGNSVTVEKKKIPNKIRWS